MTKLRLLTGITLCILIAGPAIADEAADIKSSLENGLRETFGEVAAHGDIVVAADGTGFAVSIPDLHLITEENEFFDAGTISFRLTPEGSDFYRLDQVQLPTEIPHRIADGSTDGKFTMAPQPITGLWSKTAEGFLELNADVRDIKGADDAGEGSMVIGQVAVTVASTDVGGGKWDQTGAYKLSGFSFSAPDVAFAVAGIDIAAEIRSFDLAAWGNIQDQLRAWNDSLEAAAASGAPPTVSPDVLASLQATAIPFGRMSMTFGYTGVDGAGMFSLPAGSASFSAEGLDQPMSRLTLSLAHQGLAVNDPAVAEFVPHDLALNFAMENLPAKQLWDGALSTFGGADLSSEQGMGMATMMFMGMLQQALVGGGTVINLTDWLIALPSAKATLNGKIEASQESMVGAVAQVALDITGLDNLVTAVQATPDGAEMVPMLEVLRGFSNRATGADGAVVDHYDIAFTPQGEVLINGKPFSMGGPPQ